MSLMRLTTRKQAARSKPSAARLAGQIDGDRQANGCLLSFAIMVASSVFSWLNTVGMASSLSPGTTVSPSSRFTMSLRMQLQR